MRVLRQRSCWSQQLEPTERGPTWRPGSLTPSKGRKIGSVRNTTWPVVNLSQECRQETIKIEGGGVRVIQNMTVSWCNYFESITVLCAIIIQIQMSQFRNEIQLLIMLSIIIDPRTAKVQINGSKRHVAVVSCVWPYFSGAIWCWARNVKTQFSIATSVNSSYLVGVSPRIPNRPPPIARKSPKTHTNWKMHQIYPPPFPRYVVPPEHWV